MYKPVVTFQSNLLSASVLLDIQFKCSTNQWELGISWKYIFQQTQKLYQKMTLNSTMLCSSPTWHWKLSQGKNITKYYRTTPSRPSTTLHPWIELGIGLLLHRCHKLYSLCICLTILHSEDCCMTWAPRSITCSCLS